MNKAKPILFSTPMIQAILNGQKSMTRRIIKPQPTEEKCYGICTGTTGSNKDIGKVGFGNGGNKIEFIPVKYSVGDILWVRETWRIGAWDENRRAIAVDYKADGTVMREWVEIPDEKRFNKYWIDSTDDAGDAGLELDADGEYHWEPGNAPTRWRPSIFMPREAARIFLRVTDVRVERVQDITEADAECEGVIARHDTACTGTSARISFAELWDSINDKRGYGWDKNPWAWVISFERVNISEEK